MKCISPIVASLVIAATPVASAAQDIRGGIGGVIGMGGIGVELDVAAQRFGVYGRVQASPSAGTRTAGARLYLVGERSAAFYLAAAWAQLGCGEVDLGGVATDCDGEWHNAWAVLGGAELGSVPGSWSIYVDGGPYFGIRDVPGLRDWSFVFGVRFRP